MKHFIPSYLEELKKLILKKADIRRISPSDCYRLSRDISDSTRQQISETTLKRIFGFASSRYKPSAFTLNAMADFCGFDGWNGFCEHVEKSLLVGTSFFSWEKVRQAAHKITRFTITTNKHKSGIPFEHTVDRQQINRHLEKFDKTAANVCILSAPAGFGKTIGITRWIDFQLADAGDKHPNNIYLFINAYALLQIVSSGYNGDRWLAQILGMYKEDTLPDFLNSYKNAAPGRFYLIIDELTTDLLHEKHFNLIVNQLIDMSAYFSDFSWFRFILITRPSTWQSYKHLIESSDSVRGNWFTGSSLRFGVGAINIAAFSIDELCELTNNIRKRKNDPPGTEKHIPFYIRIPINFQHYYQLKGTAIRPFNLNLTDYFSITGMFINKHILKGNKSSDKQQLANKLLQYANYKDNIVFFSKEKVYHIVRQFHATYKELLQQGLFYEHHTEHKYNYYTEIRVQSNLVAGYFLAKKLLIKTDYAFDERLISILRRIDYPSYIKMKIIKWLIRFSLEKGNLRFVSELIEADLTNINDSCMATFICQALVDDHLQTPQYIERISHQLNNSSFIDKIIRHSSLNDEFIDSFKQLLQFNLNNKNRSNAHALLGLISFFKLDDIETGRHLEAMYDLRYYVSYHSPLNPLRCLEALHHFFRYGTINRETLRNVDRLSFRFSDDNIAPLTELLVIFSLFVILLADNPRKTIRFINGILRSEVHDQGHLHADYQEMLLLIRNIEYQRLGQSHPHVISKKSGGQLEKITRFNKLLHLLIRVRSEWISGSELVTQIRHILSIVRFEKITILEVYIRMYLMKTGFSALPDNEAELRAITKNTGYRLDCFAAWVDSAIRNHTQQRKKEDPTKKHSLLS